MNARAAGSTNAGAHGTSDSITDRFSSNASRTSDQPAADFVTVLTAHELVGKQVSRAEDGGIEKTSKASISAAEAVTVHVPDVDGLAASLREVGSNPKQAIILGYVPGTEPAPGETRGEPFTIVTQAKIARLRKHMVPEDQAPRREDVVGWADRDGHRCIARLKENFAPSTWTLLDRDAVKGMPDEPVQCDDDAWFEEMTRIMPGLAAAPTVVVPSTTGRIRVDGKPLPARSFLTGVGFMRPLFARKADPDRGIEVGDIIGHRPWSIFDPTVFKAERIVFAGCPTVEGGGLSVAPPNVTIIEPADGASRIGRVGSLQLHDLSPKEEQRFHGLTGARLQRVRETRLVLGADGRPVRAKPTTVIIVERRLLGLDTLIETEIGWMTIEDYWLCGRGKLRCQTPFRASDSWNGILTATATVRLSFSTTGPPRVTSCRATPPAVRRRTTSSPRLKLRSRGSRTHRRLTC